MAYCDRGLLEEPPREMLHKRESTARLTNQQEIPTATKNTAAIQASEPEGLPWMIAIKMIVAAIEHAQALARLHQKKTGPRGASILILPSARAPSFQTRATNQPR